MVNNFKSFQIQVLKNFRFNNFSLGLQHTRGERGDVDSVPEERPVCRKKKQNASKRRRCGISIERKDKNYKAPSERHIYRTGK